MVRSYIYLSWFTIFFMVFLMILYLQEVGFPSPRLLANRTFKRFTSALHISARVRPKIMQPLNRCSWPT